MPDRAASWVFGALAFGLIVAFHWLAFRVGEARRRRRRRAAAGYHPIANASLSPE